MTITEDPSAPLVGVVGATGKQGSSVVHALADSDKAYRIRTFTRDGAKPAARALVERGVTVVVVSLTVENKDEVFKAFNGVDYAFLLTNFWEHLNADREVAEGKLLVDAAKAGGARGIIWSGLPSLRKRTSGKYTHVHYFEGKARVTEYGRASGVPFVDVQAGWYGDNFMQAPTGPPIKQADGSFVVAWPMRPTTLIPFIDVVNDYGLFVRRVLEVPVFPDGEEVYAHAEQIPIEEMTKQLAEGTGKTITFQQVSIDVFEANLKAGGCPPIVVEMMLDSVRVGDEFGWSGKSTLEGLGRPLCTWPEFVKITDWSSMLG